MAEAAVLPPALPLRVLAANTGQVFARVPVQVKYTGRDVTMAWPGHGPGRALPNPSRRARVSDSDGDGWTAGLRAQDGGLVPL